ncbi:hypothetical protein ACFQ07_30090 [Actinomadura adrarensis]|uniref:Uncharacterized protein n=1 Tax=Actinomadura adrarensis TaxID=1819600 RepID=A0ABW3CRE7_9ACTN
MKNAATCGIERDFPGWLVWVSQRGAYWGAVRLRPAGDLPATIIADSEEELRAELARQPETSCRGM